jgi:hypothetical protein
VAKAAKAGRREDGPFKVFRADQDVATWRPTLPSGLGKRGGKIGEN